MEIPNIRHAVLETLRRERYICSNLFFMMIQTVYARKQAYS